MPKTATPFSVGRSDCTGKVFRFTTQQDAETAIGLLATVIPVSVHAGDYYVDGPEELINPPRGRRGKPRHHELRFNACTCGNWKGSGTTEQVEHLFALHVRDILNA